MHLIRAAFALALSAASAVAQTPDGFKPQAQRRLVVTYGTTSVTPGIELPQALTQTQPTVTTTQSNATRYIVALLDLSLPASRVTGSGPINPGLGANRTTRLHWLQADLTVSPSGALVPYQNATPISRYAGPMPPQGDIPHAYAFFLFAQGASFQVPAALAGGAALESSAAVRNNFDIGTIAGQSAVVLLEGNYMLVQNANNSGAVTTPPTTNGTGTTNGTTTTTRPPVVTSTGGVGRIGAAALPVVGIGALVMALL